MWDKSSQDRLHRNTPSPGLSGILQSHEAPADGSEGSCAVFGYLRGLREQVPAIEFRFRSGTSIWFPYGWLGPWQYNPSEGVLLQFSGDLTYLVLIRGSNLDKPVGDGSMNLTNAGLQRHRVLWIREMTEEEIREVGTTGPTINSIEVAEFGSQEKIKEWLKEKAPGFLH